MSKSLILKIVTPEFVVYQDQVDFVSLMGVEGSFGVLPGRAPFVAQLQIATAMIERNGQRIPVAIMGGLCKVKEGHITVLTEAAELGKDIDVLRAQEKKRELEHMLQKTDADLTLQVDHEARLKKALVRLRTAELVRGA